MQEAVLMRAIFLDVDGVLNHDTSMELTKDYWTKPEPYLIEKLKQIVDATGAKIVLSSDWRFDRNDDEEDNHYLTLVRMLREYNMDIWDFTPYLGSVKRGIEISQYVAEHENEIESFVILDDRCDMEPVKDKLVRADPSVGLTNEDVLEAIDILLNN
jgi:hypothetical protein